MSTTNAKLIALGVLGVAGLIWYASRRVSSAGGLAGMAGSAAQSAVEAVGAAGVGVVKGIGSVLGVPDTNRSACEADIASGRWLDASFSCPAGTFINAGAGSVFGSTVLWGGDSDEAKRIEAARARAQYALTDPRRVDLPPAFESNGTDNAGGMDFRYF